MTCACPHYAFIPVMYMRRNSIIVSVVFCFLVLLISCSQPKKNMGNTKFDKNYDNSEYVLKTQKLVVEGIGMSLDYNTAQFKALENVQKNVLDTVAEIVKHITIRRGFDSSLPNEIYVSALRHVSYYDDEAYNDEGVLMHRSACTAEVMLMPMLQSIYQAKHFESEYGFYQFLRDVDWQVLTH